MKEGNSEKFKHWLQLLFSLFGVIGIVYGFVSSLSGNIVTKEKLQEHNLNEKSHPIIVQNITDCDGKVEALSKRVEESHEVEIALGARLVRLLAADEEGNRSLKAAAANYYEQEYKHKIRKGMSVEDAILESLREPYYGKPRVR